MFLRRYVAYFPRLNVPCLHSLTQEIRNPLVKIFRRAVIPVRDNPRHIPQRLNLPASLNLTRRVHIPLRVILSPKRKVILQPTKHHFTHLKPAHQVPVTFLSKAGIPEKTQSLPLRKLNERLRNTVLRQPLVIVQVMLDYHMIVRVQQRPPRLILAQNLFARIVLARLPHRREEHRVILTSRTKLIIPLLHKKHARLRPCVWLEDVFMEADNREYPALPRDEVPYVFVAGIVEASLRQYDCHSSAGLEELEVALDEENITPDFVHGISLRVLPKLVTG